MCEMADLTLHFGLIKGNVTHNNWDRSRYDPLCIITQPHIVMYVITTIIKALEMAYTNRAPKGQPKIILDISGLGGAPRASITHFFPCHPSTNCKYLELQVIDGAT